MPPKLPLAIMSSPTPSVFSDKAQAASYDERSARLAPMYQALHWMTRAILADLPADARILCVGVGTGAELLSLARAFPDWHFTAVEPAAAMLDVCRQRAEEEGIASRCVFHQGYLDSLPGSGGFHAALSVLVSQFILHPAERREFFFGIAGRLLPGGYLVSADLSADLSTAEYESMLAVWLRLMIPPELLPERGGKLRSAYARDLAIIPPREMETLLASGNFEEPVQFFQSLLVHAWFARRSPHPSSIKVGRGGPAAP
jgi:tRNA (cmo5U34)-methyltransferase